MNKISTQQKILIDAFIESEKLDFNNKKDLYLDRTKSEIIKTIEEKWNGGYIEIISIGNAGLMVRSLTLDFYRTDHDFKKSGKIILCNCGTSWSLYNSEDHKLYFSSQCYRRLD